MQRDAVDDGATVPFATGAVATRTRPAKHICAACEASAVTREVNRVENGRDVSGLRPRNRVLSRRSRHRGVGCEVCRFTLAGGNDPDTQQAYHDGSAHVRLTLRATPCDCFLV